MDEGTSGKEIPKEMPEEHVQIFRTGSVRDFLEARGKAYDAGNDEKKQERYEKKQERCEDIKSFFDTIHKNFELALSGKNEDSIETQKILELLEKSAKEKLAGLKQITEEALSNVPSGTHSNIIQQSLSGRGSAERNTDEKPNYYRSLTDPIDTDSSKKTPREVGEEVSHAQDVIKVYKSLEKLIDDCPDNKYLRALEWHKWKTLNDYLNQHTQRLSRSLNPPLPGTKRKAGELGEELDNEGPGKKVKLDEESPTKKAERLDKRKAEEYDDGSSNKKARLNRAEDQQKTTMDLPAKSERESDTLLTFTKARLELFSILRARLIEKNKKYKKEFIMYKERFEQNINRDRSAIKSDLKELLDKIEKYKENLVEKKSRIDLKEFEENFDKTIEELDSIQKFLMNTDSFSDAAEKTFNHDWNEICKKQSNGNDELEGIDSAKSGSIDSFNNIRFKEKSNILDVNRVYFLEKQKNIYTKYNKVLIELHIAIEESAINFNICMLQERLNEARNDEKYQEWCRSADIIIDDQEEFKSDLDKIDEEIQENLDSCEEKFGSKSKKNKFIDDNIKRIASSTAEGSLDIQGEKEKLEEKWAQDQEQEKSKIESSGFDQKLYHIKAYQVQIEESFADFGVCKLRERLNEVKDGEKYRNWCKDAEKKLDAYKIFKGLLSKIDENIEKELNNIKEKYKENWNEYQEKEEKRIKLYGFNQKVRYIKEYKNKVSELLIAFNAI